MKFRSIILAGLLGISAVGAAAAMPAGRASEAPSNHQKDWEFSDLALLALGIAGLVAGRQTIRKHRR